MNPHFSNVYFSENNDKQVKNEIKRLLFIDSRDEFNTLNNYNPFDFTIYFEDKEIIDGNGNKTIRRGLGIEPYRNISKFELKHVCVPKMNNSEHYVILDIPELSDYLDSSDNKGSHRSSCIVYYDKNDQEANTVKPSYENHVFTFGQNIQALNQLSVSFKTHFGTKMDLSMFDQTKLSGSDIDKNKALHTSLLFEVTYSP